MKTTGCLLPLLLLSFATLGQRLDQPVRMWRGYNPGFARPVDSVATNYTYDAANRLIAEEDAGSFGTLPQSRTTHAYDSAGNDTATIVFQRMFRGQGYFWAKRQVVVRRYGVAGLLWERVDNYNPSSATPMFDHFLNSTRTVNTFDAFSRLVQKKTGMSWISPADHATQDSTVYRWAAGPTPPAIGWDSADYYFTPGNPQSRHHKRTRARWQNFARNEAASLFEWWMNDQGRPVFLNEGAAWERIPLPDGMLTIERTYMIDRNDTTVPYKEVGQLHTYSTNGGQVKVEYAVNVGLTDTSSKRITQTDTAGNIIRSRFWTEDPISGNLSLTASDSAVYTYPSNSRSLVLADKFNLLAFPTADWSRTRFEYPSVQSVKAGQALALALAPNPAAGLVEIRLPSAEGRAEATVRDAMGRPCLQAYLEPGRQGLDVGPLAAGIYTVEVRLQGQVYRSRLVRQ